jgi:hypothetical protein
MLLLVVVHAVLAAAPVSPGLRAADLVLLLEIGVSEQEITEFAERAGGFEALDAATYAQVESLGATTEFLDKLPRTTPEVGEISDLARRCEVFDDARLKISFIHPAGWVVSRGSSADGDVILRVGPRTFSEPRIFASPCLFIFLKEQSGLIPEAVEPARAEIRQLVLQRLRSAGIRPQSTTSRTTPFLGSPCETFLVEAPVDGDEAGVLEIALGVDPRGRAVGIGFTASAADRASTEQAFSTLARSVVLR